MFGFEEDYLARHERYKDLVREADRTKLAETCRPRPGWLARLKAWGRAKLKT